MEMNKKIEDNVDDEEAGKELSAMTLQGLRE